MDRIKKLLVFVLATLLFISNIPNDVAKGNVEMESSSKERNSLVSIQKEGGFLREIAKKGKQKAKKKKRKIKKQKKVYQSYSPKGELKLKVKLSAVGKKVDSIFIKGKGKKVSLEKGKDYVIQKDYIIFKKAFLKKLKAGKYQVILKHVKKEFSFALQVKEKKDNQKSKKDKKDEKVKKDEQDKNDKKIEEEGENKKDKEEEKDKKEEQNKEEESKGNTIGDLGFYQGETRVDSIRFEIRNKRIEGIKKEGLKDIERTHTVIIPEGVQEIGEGIFKNLNLTKIKFPGTLKKIGSYAFYGNQLEAVEIPTSVLEIGRGAFDHNNLKELELKNPKCKIDGIFYNNQYVNIITSNPNIKDESYKTTTIGYVKPSTVNIFHQGQPQTVTDRKPYGSVVNRASVKVVYYDELEKKEFEEIIVSKDRKNRTSRVNDDFNKYYKIGEKVNVVALKNDYLHLGSMKIIANLKNKVEFHYNEEAPDFMDDEVSKKPKINGTKQPLLVITDSPLYSHVDYKKGIYASDYKMNDISGSVIVENENEIDIRTPGVYKVRYRVTDKEGNEGRAERKLYVEEEKVWYPHDFYYDNDILLGLSDIGEWKLNEILTNPRDKRIDLPIETDKKEVVRKVASAAFARLRIREISIPNGYEEIRPFAFESTLLASLVMPDSIRIVGERAFAFADIETMKLSANLEKIGSRAFASLNLKEISIPEKVTEIGEGAFANNHKVKNGELRIPAGVRVIPKNAFENCKINHLILQEGLQEIGNYAFGKNNITEVKYLPDSLTKLAPDAFKHNGISNGSNYVAAKLYTKNGQNPHRFESNIFQKVNPKAEEELTIQDMTEEDYTINNGELGIAPSGKEKLKKIKRIERLEIPKKIRGELVTKIPTMLFMYKKIEALELPDTLEFIGNSAFAGNKLQSLTIPASVKEIDESAFYGNTALKNLELMEGLQKIGKNAFWNSSLTRVMLPESIKEIGDKAFRLASSAKKVILVISSKDETKDFIRDNRGRKDFILEVIGEVGEEVTLETVETKHGVKAPKALKFRIKNRTEKPVVKVNGTEVSAVFANGVVSIYGSSYMSLLNESGEQEISFTYSDQTYTKRIKAFSPKEFSIKDKKSSYPYENGLHLEFSQDKFEFENIKLYKTMTEYQALSGFQFQGTVLQLSKEWIERIKTGNVLRFAIDGEYQKKTLIEVNLEETVVDLGLTFTMQSPIGDTGVYQSNALSEALFGELKEKYEEDGVTIRVGRTKFTKNYSGEKEALGEEEYILEFNETERTVLLAINKPEKWETLEFEFGGKIFSYDIEDDLSLTAK